MTRDAFKPHPLLSNRHVQTIWGVVFRQQKKPTTTFERLELTDGDFVDLEWIKGEGPLVIILHGLEGSSDSHYAKGMLNTIQRLDWQAVIMHFRNCSQTPNRLTRSYHAGETGDIDFLYHSIKQRMPNTPLFVIGYSLGGNVLVKWLAEKSPDIIAACAVSVPFDLQKSVGQLQKGFSKIYDKKLLYSLKRSHKRKDKTSLKEVKTIYDFDDKVTSKVHGFKNAEAYYQQNHSLQFLPEVTTPLLIIQAEDDPFHPPTLALDNLNPNTLLEFSPHGGHVGFITGSLFGKPEYWLEKRIPEYFSNEIKRLHSSSSPK